MMRKFQSVERAEVLSPAEHQRIESNLHRVGKTAAKDLDEDQRESVLTPAKQSE